MRLFTQRHDDDGLRLRLALAEARIRDFERMIDGMKQYDWFEFTKQGSVVAHKNDEPEGPWLLGTVFIVPEDIVTIEC